MVDKELKATKEITPMCLAIPAKIVSCEGEAATVEVHGVRRTVNVTLIDAPQAGDYVLLHAGFAIQKWTEAEVRELNVLLDQVDAAGGEPS